MKSRTKYKIRENSPHFWYYLQIWENPKISLRFYNSLEGLTELTKTIIPSLRFILGKGYRLKLGKGKSAQSRVQEKYWVQSFHFPLPMKSGYIALLKLICDNMHGILPTSGTHLNLVSRDLIGVSSCRHNWLTDCPCG